MWEVYQRKLGREFSSGHASLSATYEYTDVTLDVSVDFETNESVLITKHEEAVKCVEFSSDLSTSCLSLPTLFLY